MTRHTVLGYAAFAATISMATACDKNIPTSPMSDVGPVVSAVLPVGTVFTGPATPVNGQIVVCKTIASHQQFGVPTTATFTYDITFDYQGQTQPQDQVVHTVTLSPGQCATVFNRPTPSSPIGGAEFEAIIAITERSQSGYSINNITINQTSPAVTGALPNTSGATANMAGNYYHGYVVNYTNQTTSITPAGNPDTIGHHPTFPGTLTPGHVVVCKSTTNFASGATTTFNFNTSATSTNAQPSDQIAAGSVSLAPGECAVVFIRTTGSNPRQVTVTEAPHAGYVTTNVTTQYNTAFGTPTQPNTSTSGTVLVNQFHGAVITFTNATDIGTTGEPGPTGGVCVRSQGYFKNHQSDVAGILSSPVNTTTTFLSGGLLTIGGEPNLSAANIVAYLGRPTRGNVRISVERQLIAAELNILAGASATTAIMNEIAEANTILANSSLTSAQVARLHAIESDLDEYSNGDTGDSGNSAHCG